MAVEPTREQLMACVTAIAMECWPKYFDTYKTRDVRAEHLKELPKYVAEQIERLELTLAAITEIRNKLETIA